ncbi:MAG: hypothetical protein ACFFBH_00840 [Promethearchaeota archaeon]
MATGGFVPEPAEFNTIITMLGCLCATVQLGTGIYAAYKKRKIALIKTNDALFRAHRAFGSFATVFYFLGLFAGLSGFIGAILLNNPPFEILDISFNIHVWPSFLVMVVIIWKTLISYFKKPLVYKQGKWLGIATFVAWAYTWITSAVSFYLRTLPSNPQHSEPLYLLDIELIVLQIILPFIIGVLISYFVLKAADKIEKKKLIASQKK